MAFAGRAPSRHAQTPNARLVLRNTNAHGRRPNIWPQALQAPIQHQRPTDHQIHVHYHKYPTNPPSTNTMPPKQRTPVSGAAPTTTSTPARSTKSTGTDAQDILQGIYNKYVQKTPQRVKLLDTFMAFLVVVGALQFFYVVLVGNFVRIPAPYMLQAPEEMWQDMAICEMEVLPFTNTF
jgi:hypothetical protein